MLCLAYTYHEQDNNFTKVLKLLYLIQKELLESGIIKGKRGKEKRETHVKRKRGITSGT